LLVENKTITSYIFFIPKESKNNEITAVKRPVFDLTKVEITDELATVSMIADRINCILIETGSKKTYGKQINDWLVKKGYLQPEVVNGKTFKIPTKSGEALGIISEERTIRGENSKVNFFGREAQNFIVKNSMEFLNL